MGGFEGRNRADSEDFPGGLGYQTQKERVAFRVRLAVNGRSQPMKLPTPSLFLFILLAPSLLLAQTPLKLGPHRGVSFTPKAEGVTEIAVTEPSPHFWSQVVTVPAGQTVLAFDYFSPSGVDSISFRFREADGSMTLAGSAPLPLAETWQPFAIELEGLPTTETRLHVSLKYRPETGFQLRNWRMREATEAERRNRAERESILAAREADAAAYLNYLRDFYAAEIEEVVVEPEVIRITGRAPKPVRLIELPPQVPSHGDSPIPPLGEAQTGTFTMEVPRFEAGTQRDRAQSRWRLQEKGGAIASLARWPSSVAEGIADVTLPKAEGKSQKGIGGVPAIGRSDHPIFELGAHHATVNVVIDGLMSREKRPGWKPWDFEGTTFYLNENFLRGKDSTIRHLCAQDIVVTCILLVGNGPNAPLKHPEAEPRGIYSMPNLTTEAGCKLYRAALEFLAERYSQPESRIANWVLHNEIDQHGTWTNMGDQPLARYLEIYARSARLVYHTARLHDPHARVFVSLTHHWTKRSLGKGSFVVRELVDLWTEICAAEGEYDWGVAYHPYPQNLRDPDTWDDEDVSFDFDTPYITPKNIEVLPAYLGPDRPILLSEQGFNSPTLSEEDQKRQAAGLIYMFRKLPELPTIEAYHLHRYQDMPDREGGLRLGIMDENGNRKLGWHTYVAIGTEAEAKFAAAADEILPEPIPVQEITTPQPPNIVLIVADDLGWSDTTPYLDPNEDFYETPAIADLAKRGMTFRNAYSSSPLCSPTRASLLTGQYPGRIRLTTPAAHLPQVVLNPGVPEVAGPTKHAVEPGTRTRFPNSYITIAERLKARDFATAFVGKWHLGHAPYLPDQQGFDLVIGGRHHPGPPGGFFAPWPIDTILEAPEGSHIDDVITDESIAWLDAQKAAGKPFFLNLWYYSVHAPFQAKPELIEKYREKAKTLPAGARRSNPVMAAMIETLDENVGRISEALERLGLAENTLFIFTSDNGGNEYNYTAGQFATNNHPLRNGKGNINEGGQRVPFIAVWPGQIAAGSENPGLVSSIDLFPTFLDAADQAPAPAQVIDGISLLPTLQGTSAIPTERAIFCHFPHSPTATGSIAATSVRRGPWKLTRFFADGPEQADRLRLVNLDSDPGEQNDLSASQPELAQELNALITVHLEETASLVPRPNPSYVPSALGWTGSGDAKLTRIDDALQVDATGNDPWISTSDFPKGRGKVTIDVEMDRGGATSSPTIYWATQSAKGFHKDRSLIPIEVKPGHYRIDLDLEGEVLSALRIDPTREPGTTIVHAIRLIQWKPREDGEGKVQRLWDF